MKKAGKETLMSEIRGTRAAHQMTGKGKLIVGGLILVFIAICVYGLRAIH